MYSTQLVKMSGQRPIALDHLQQRVASERDARKPAAFPTDAPAPGAAVEGRVALPHLLQRVRLGDRPRARRAAAPERPQPAQESAVAGAVEPVPPTVQDIHARISDKGFEPCRRLAPVDRCCVELRSQGVTLVLSNVVPASLSMVCAIPSAIKLEYRGFR